MTKQLIILLYGGNMEDEPKHEPIKKKKKIKVLTIVSIIVLVLIFLYGAFAVYQRYFKHNTTASILNPLQLNVSEDLTIVNRLDGTKVLPDKATRHPLAIMIENHPDARPQAGLDKASIVYEAITEGGITRFMAVYGPYDATKVGPVRSARTYYIDWLKEFDAFYAHVGGNLDALQKIKTDGVLDLDQFGLGTIAYNRISKAGLATEHSMYTSTDKLYAYAFDKKKWAKTGNFTALDFTTALDEINRTSGQTIDIDFSTPSYKVKWTYDKTSNTYLRELGGIAHKDQITGKQLNASNIIIQSVERRVAVTEINENGYAMTTIGSGKAMIFSQGKQITGTWSKTDQDARTKFLDETGVEVPFVPGQFWIEIVPPDVFSQIQITDTPGPNQLTN